MRLKLRLLLIPTVAGILMAAQAGPASAKDNVREEMHKTFPLTTDGRVQLNTLNGDVRITTWDRPEIQVHAVKHGETRELVDQARIVINSEPDHINIKTEYQKTSSKGNLRRNSARVDYDIKVPKQARLRDVHTTNGNLELDGLSGEVKASSTNGKLTAKGLESEAHFECVNGSLRADMKSLGLPLSAKSVNGSVDVVLPSDSNANVTAKTVNGSIHSSAGLRVVKKWPVGSEMTGKLGNGGTPVKIETVNGSINIALSGSARASLAERPE